MAESSSTLFEFRNLVAKSSATSERSFAKKMYDTVNEIAVANKAEAHHTMPSTNRRLKVPAKSPKRMRL